MTKRETQHDRKVKAVEAAIEELFADTTVDRETTANDLRDIIDDLRIKLDALWN